MTTFLLSYRMPKGYTPGRPDAMAAWSAWFEAIGADLVDPGNPVFEASALGNCGKTPPSVDTRWSAPKTSRLRWPWPTDARRWPRVPVSRSARSPC